MKREMDNKISREEKNRITEKRWMIWGAEKSHSACILSSMALY